MGENLSSSIAGCVYDAKGNPVGGVKITCDGYETITLFDGTYKFTDLKPSNYTVTVNLKGFQVQSKTVEAKADIVTVADFRLVEAVGDAKVYGYVYDDEAKQPITSGGTVILILPVSNRFANINREGYFEFSKLPLDTYEIYTSIHKYIDKKIVVTVMQGETKRVDIYCTHEPFEEPFWG